MGASTLELMAATTIGYLLGSIPFGLLLTRAAGLGDIRKVGSGNIGATNVLRTGNKGLAAATLLLDALKGTAAVLLVWWLAHFRGPNIITDANIDFAAIFAARQQLMTIAGLGAFLGHIYPIWLGFKGGKGVATFIGVLAGIFWPAALAFCAVWLLVAFATRYSSLSALIASLASPVIVWVLGVPRLAIMIAPLSLLLIYTHRANIARLLKGEEPKIGAKA